MKRKKSILIGILLVVFLTGLTGMGLLFLYKVQTDLMPSLLKYAIWGLLGLAGGLFARWLLKDRTLILRLLTAILAVIAGLAVMDALSHGYIGIDLLEFDHSYPHWDSIIQMSIPAAAAFLSLLAWRPNGLSKTQPVVKPTPAPKASARPVPAPKKVKKPVKKQVKAKPKKNILGIQPAGQPKVKAAKKPRKAVGVKPKKQSRRAKPKVKKAAPAAKPKKIFTGRKRKRNQEHVRLVGAEEHRCPFCLEEIDLNDPRGVEICPICKTYHHADCWEVTGTCQVPHYQS